MSAKSTRNLTTAEIVTVYIPHITWIMRPSSDIVTVSQSLLSSDLLRDQNQGKAVTSLNEDVREVQSKGRSLRENKF